MHSKRLPRFRRSPSVRPFRLTVRDHDILRQIHRHRFLRSEQIIVLTTGSRQQILRRLQLLYHHRYLERPRSQIDYYHQGGSCAFIYGLAAKGRNFLKQAGLFTAGHPKEGSGQIYLQHTLMVSEVMTGLRLASRLHPHLRLIPQDEMANLLRSGWTVPVKQGGSTKRVSLLPDHIFALSEGNRLSIFLLEADRATMPITRRSLAQSSVQRKLLAYEALWKQGKIQQQFGTARVRVLFVTSSPVRTSRIISAVKTLGSGQGLFLCTDLASFRQAQDKLALPWASVRGEETAF